MHMTHVLRRRMETHNPLLARSPDRYHLDLIGPTNLFGEKTSFFRERIPVYWNTALASNFELCAPTLLCTQSTTVRWFSTHLSKGGRVPIHIRDSWRLASNIYNAFADFFTIETARFVTVDPLELGRECS